MRCYWLKFEDGSEGHCEGEGPYHAVAIAEKLTGKKVAGGPEFKYSHDRNPNVQGLPYSNGRNLIWQFDCPVGGKAWTMCYGGAECRGKSSCPKNRACSE